MSTYQRELLKCRDAISASLREAEQTQLSIERLEAIASYHRAMGTMQSRRLLEVEDQIDLIRTSLEFSGVLYPMSTID